MSHVVSVLVDLGVEELEGIAVPNPALEHLALAAAYQIERRKVVVEAVAERRAVHGVGVGKRAHRASKRVADFQ